MWRLCCCKLAGCAMSKPNKKKQVPKPGPNLLSCNAKLFSWWSTNWRETPIALLLPCVRTLDVIATHSMWWRIVRPCRMLEIPFKTLLPSLVSQHGSLQRRWQRSKTRKFSAMKEKIKIFPWKQMSNYFKLLKPIAAVPQSFWKNIGAVGEVHIVKKGHLVLRRMQSILSAMVKRHSYMQRRKWVYEAGQNTHLHLLRCLSKDISYDV